MTDVPFYNFPRFDEVAQDLRARGHDVTSPAEMDRTNGIEPHPDGHDPSQERYGKEYQELLARDEEIIAQGGIEGVVFLEGWADSNGAIREGKKMLEAGGLLFTYTPEHPEGILPLPAWAFELCASVYEGDLSWDCLALS